MIIGFGSTETDFENAEESAFFEFVKEQYRGGDTTYFSADLVSGAKAFLDARSKDLHEAARIYKTASEYPSRYSYTYPRLISDASDLVAVVTFHHINRRHGLSPDGWALLKSKKLFHVSVFDVQDSLSERAA